MSKNWKTIKDEREKYAAYLASREWSVLKEAVHKRANGMCERCGVFPIDAVHHTTYARKYHEELDDLQGNCNHCHAFTHAKSQRDPLQDRTWIRYIRRCREQDKRAVNWLMSEGMCLEPCIGVIEHCMTQARIIEEIHRQTFSGANEGEEVSDAASQYQEIAQAVQDSFCQFGYLLWIQMDRPVPTFWGETWEDVV